MNLKLLVDGRITTQGTTAPAAVLLRNVEDPLRRCTALVTSNNPARGLVFDAAKIVQDSQSCCIKVYSFDGYDSLICHLEFVAADPTSVPEFGNFVVDKNVNLYPGDRIFGVRTLDCRSAFEIMTIFGRSPVDMPAFSVSDYTNMILVAVFDEQCITNYTIAESVAQLIRANTTVSGVEPCDTVILDG